MTPAEHPGFSLLFFAPFYNRSGYGVAARGLAAAWHRCGIPLRIVPLDEIEEGIDDCDLNLLKTLESAPIALPLAAIFFHVPSPAWLSVELPEGCLRVMYTTFDGYARGSQPPPMWIRICNEMDQIWVMNVQEAAVWAQAGADPAKLKVLPTPHPWVDNPSLPPLSFEARRKGSPFRFLSMGMFQPRRRWDTLIEAFLLEFRETPGVELVLKANYPSWHPVPGKPQRDLSELIEALRVKTASKAEVRLDDVLGTRLDICRIIDRCDVYVSTDTTSTAPISEAHVRGKLTILPESYGQHFGTVAGLHIPEDTRNSIPMTESMLDYQPHHRGTSMPLLRVEDLRPLLRAAYEMPKAELEARGRATAASASEGSRGNIIQNYIDALREGFDLNRKQAALRATLPSAGIGLRWEGSQFVHHSLAHVNRQICLGLLGSGEVDLSLVPYEPDQFDGASVPAFKALADRVWKRLPGPAAVHVRHQWPPNFEAPREGCWVMIQPWEFGGVPQEWVDPMCRQVDEIWAYTTWVRDCYIKSGVPPEKIAVIPLGVNSEVFCPEGEGFPLQTTKAFKFLFLGGTIHRKGIDVLLKAYQAAFRASDDVCLVIKGQAGEVYRGNELDEVLRQIRQDPQAPEIEYRVETLSEPELAALYRSCEAFVLPYRGEGFGLPIAEAMASGLPVIVTGRGAAMDFVREEWAYLIPSHVQPLARVDRYQPGPAGFWLEEPHAEALAGLLRRAFDDPEEAREKGKRARDFAVLELRWERSVEGVLARLKVLNGRRPCRFEEATATTVNALPEALVYEPDWSQAEWVEVLLAYLQAFTPGEAVALVLPLSEGPGSLSCEAAQQAVVELIGRTGREAFPDIVLAESPQELDQILGRYGRVQNIPEGRGSVEGLGGAFGLRFAQARLRLSGS